MTRSEGKSIRARARGNIIVNLVTFGQGRVFCLCGLCVCGLCVRALCVCVCLCVCFVCARFVCALCVLYVCARVLCVLCVCALCVGTRLGSVDPEHLTNLKTISMTNIQDQNCH